MGWGWLFRSGVRVGQPDRDFVDVAKTAAHEEPLVQRGAQAPLGVLDSYQDIVVARPARGCPTDVLRALGTDLSPGAGQRVIDEFGAGVAQFGQPFARPVDWPLVGGNADGAYRRSGGIGAILFKIRAQVGLQIGPDSLDMRTLGTAEVHVPAAEIEHVSEELLETEGRDLDCLAAGERLLIMPAAWHDHGGDNAKLDRQN